MNIISFTDAKMSDMSSKIGHEVKRRSRAATKGLDAAAIIHGNELAKRALIVAAAGRHSILFIGPPNCGKTMMRAAAIELGLHDTFEARPCPCGNPSRSKQGPSVPTGRRCSFGTRIAEFARFDERRGDQIAGLTPGPRRPQKSRTGPRVSKSRDAPRVSPVVVFTESAGS